MPNPQAISKKSFLAASLEAVSGTLAATQQYYVPCKSVMKGVQRDEKMSEERGTRDDNNDRVQTTRDGSTDPKGAWYNDTSPIWLFGITGLPTASQPDSTHAPTVYKQTIPTSFSDIPPTLSLWKSYHRVTYYTASAAVKKVTLKWTVDKGLECDVDLFHLFPTKYVGSTLTPTFSSVRAFSGYMPTITTADGATTDVEECTMTIEQDVKPWFAPNGTPDFTRLDFGARKCTIDLTARFDLDTGNPYLRFLDFQDDSLTFDIKGALIVNSGGSGTPPNTNYYQELSLTFGTVGYDSGEHDLGKDNVLVKMKGTVRPTSGALFTGFVQNTVAQYVGA